MSDELVEAWATLLPQLSSSAPPVTREILDRVVGSDATSLLVATIDGRIVGSLTLAVFETPTGVRSWVEDVVVDQSVRGRGVGEKLTRAAVALAGTRGARTVDLTSRPDRAAANRLYQRVGFQARATNIYRVTDPQPQGLEALWDERYARSEQIWSGQPNLALVAEVSDLTPGRALDVGCGEGADAVWLAARGWDVTALDVSLVAIERARRHAADSGVDVHWLHSGLLEAGLSPGAFDLVSAQYPALPRTAGDDVEQALFAAVAPGGMLLYVHHADVDRAQAKAHGFDPADYVSPADIGALLVDDDAWQIEVDEKRPRVVATGGGSHHTHDLVLLARRLR